MRKTKYIVKPTTQFKKDYKHDGNIQCPKGRYARNEKVYLIFVQSACFSLRDRVQYKNIRKIFNQSPQ